MRLTPQWGAMVARVQHGGGERFGVSWHGLVLSRSELALDEVAHWPRIQGQQFARYEMAGHMAGGNCGSGVPEIKQLLAETLVAET